MSLDCRCQAQGGFVSGVDYSCPTTGRVSCPLATLYVMVTDHPESKMKQPVVEAMVGEETATDCDGSDEEEQEGGGMPSGGETKGSHEGRR